ncbi:P-loop containing nucleoside triphosphate hydrolase protein [Butyriboletus roseoflavus]|nr:P-loop containing nucleoside triphosphate hydrolase protein [Butyriboletus roseoflavus]
MDDYDAFLYSLDDPELFEEGESDNDVLDNIDEEQPHTDAAVVLVPASSPTRERGNGDEQSEPNLTVLKLMTKCNRVLTERFGFSGYKGKQKEIIQAAISGADVFVLAPTGMGKSLCFQVPAIAEECGISIIVSPLLALMKNQVTNLRRKGISAVSLTSETTKGEKSEIMSDLSSKRPKNCLFYTTPEKLCKKDFMGALASVYSNGQLSRLVIDEAHCISEWGHDFREEYRKLGSFRERFPGVPIMALTATATKNVQQDIIRSLKMVEDKLFTAVHPFNRTNLFYEVRYKSAPETHSLMQDILEFIEALHRRRNRPSSGIIYCRKRETCDELSNYLRGKGLNARPYHGGINAKTLSKTLKEWEVGGTGEGGVDVVCATIAFGMGIDKNDVRYIIHYDLPKSMEGYYQETGRAGRDGSPSRCILYYSREDALRLRKLVSSTHARRQDTASSKNRPEPSQRSIDSLGALVSFAENVTTCRHVSICRYFGEIIDTTDDDVMESICDKMCDVCKYPDKTPQRKTNLSDEEYAAAVISKSAWNTGYEDDEDSERRKPQQQQRAPVSAGASANAPNPGQMTLWDCLDSAPVQGFKRPNAHGHDKLGLPNSKRAKMEDRTTKGTISTNNASTSTSTGARASMPRPLVTRPHSSANSLRKPFKTPFKTPFQVPDESHNHVVKGNDHDRGRQSEKLIPSPPVQNHHAQNDEESDNDVEILEVRMKQEPTPPNNDAADDQMNMDMEIPEVKMEVEASFSRKVPLETRTSVFDALRKSFHRVFPLDAASTGNTAWRIIGGAPTSVEGRTLVLADAAKKLEHAIHLMCATPSGYQTRVAQKRQAIASLDVDKGNGGAKNGAREDEDEDVGEVMDALRGGVEWWHKMHKGLVQS